MAQGRPHACLYLDHTSTTLILSAATSSIALSCAAYSTRRCCVPSQSLSTFVSQLQKYHPDTVNRYFIYGPKSCSMLQQELRLLLLLYPDCAISTTLIPSATTLSMAPSCAVCHSRRYYVIRQSLHAFVSRLCNKDHSNTVSCYFIYSRKLYCTP